MFLLGFKAPRELVSELVAEIINGTIEEHDSLFFGENDFVLVKERKVRIRENWDLMWIEGDPPQERFAYPDHRAFSVIVEVDGIDFVRSITEHAEGKLGFKYLGNPDAT